jgi:hypothetical protein
MGEVKYDVDPLLLGLEVVCPLRLSAGGTPRCGHCASEQLELIRRGRAGGELAEWGVVYCCVGRTADVRQRAVLAPLAGHHGVKLALKHGEWTRVWGGPRLAVCADGDAALQLLGDE